MEWVKATSQFINDYALPIMFGVWAAEKIAQKTKTKWDDKVVAVVKSVVTKSPLGILSKKK